MTGETTTKTKTSPVSTLKAEADMAARLKNSLARTVKADIALGALPDYHGYGDGDEENDNDDVDGGDDKDDDNDGGDDDNDDNPPVCLFRARQPQLSSQARRLLLCLARLRHHSPLHYAKVVMGRWK